MFTLSPLRHPLRLPRAKAFRSSCDSHASPPRGRRGMPCADDQTSNPMRRRRRGAAQIGQRRALDGF
jgi:hypothetical protein